MQSLWTRRNRKTTADHDFSSEKLVFRDPGNSVYTLKGEEELYLTQDCFKIPALTWRDNDLKIYFLRKYKKYFFCNLVILVSITNLVSFIYTLNFLLFIPFYSFAFPSTLRGI